MKVIINWEDLIDLVSHLKQMPTGYIKLPDFCRELDYHYFVFTSPLQRYTRYYDMEVVKEE